MKVFRQRRAAHIIGHAAAGDLPIPLFVGGGARSDRSALCARHQRRVNHTFVVGGSAIEALPSSASSIPFPRSARLLRRRSGRERP